MGGGRDAAVDGSGSGGGLGASWATGTSSATGGAGGLSRGGSDPIRGGITAVFDDVNTHGSHGVRYIILMYGFLVVVEPH